MCVRTYSDERWAKEHIMRTITRSELARAIEDGTVVVLEALPAMYFEAEHLPGAENLPLDDIERLAPTLVPDRSTAIVTYCSGPTCQNSRLAAQRLLRLGYTDVRAYEGGKEEWIGAGLPTEHGIERAAR
jgi:rhodanese-related sulfurtransferase